MVSFVVSRLEDHATGDATAMPRDHSIPISGLPWKTVVPIQGQRMGKSGGQSVWIPFYNDPKNETNKPNTEMLSKYLGILWYIPIGRWMNMGIEPMFQWWLKRFFFPSRDGTHGIVTTWLGPWPMKSNWLILHQLHLYHTPESILLLVTNKSPLKHIKTQKIWLECVSHYANTDSLYTQGDVFQP